MAIEFHRLTDCADSLFAVCFSLYETSFPVWERRGLAEQLRLLAEPDYHCEAVTADGTFVGLLCWWALDTGCYVEHLATAPALRGHGLGAEIMRAMQARHTSMVLEIDPPEDEISRRRLGFYQRLGFVVNDYDYRQAAYRLGMEDVPLRLLSWPEMLANPPAWEQQIHKRLAPFASPK